MRLEYALSEDDFLTFQLYNISMSDRFAAHRSKDRLRLPGLSLLFGVILLFDDRESIWAYILIVSSFLFFVFYKWWSAWFYKRMYRRQIRESMKGDSPCVIELLFTLDVIELKNKNGQSSFSVQNVKCITEIGEYFYIAVDQIYIIIPKSQIADLDVFQSYLEAYKEDLKIPYMQKIDWKWS